MSTEDDDKVIPAFADEAERAEYEWLRARDRDPDAPPPSAQVAREYEVLEDLLGSLPVPPLAAAAPLPPVEEVAGARPRRRSRWWLAAVAAALVAALILVLVIVPPAQFGSRGRVDQIASERGLFSIRVAKADTLNRRAIGLGDVATLEVDDNHERELRVYRDQALIARCPRGPACGPAGTGTLTLTLRVDRLGTYDVVLLEGATQLGAPPEVGSTLPELLKLAGDRIVDRWQFRP